jgi:hypothetical protein
MKFFKKWEILKKQLIWIVRGLNKKELANWKKNFKISNKSKSQFSILFLTINDLYLLLSFSF